MLKHILVPLDGSKFAEDALRYASDILAPNGKLTLVCAVTIPEMPVYGAYPTVTIPDFEITDNELIPQAKQYLEKVVLTLGKPDLTVAYEVKLGDAASVICDIAEKLKVDAIVMSSHGRSGIGRLLFGSVTNKVLGARVCPVMIVPSKEEKPTEVKQ
ncbi:MAG: universal stress protein [Chloroflexota bacterium]